MGFWGTEEFDLLKVMFYNARSKGEGETRTAKGSPRRRRDGILQLFYLQKCPYPVESRRDESEVAQRSTNRDKSIAEQEQSERKHRKRIGQQDSRAGMGKKWETQRIRQKQVGNAISITATRRTSHPIAAKIRCIAYNMGVDEFRTK